MSQDDRVSAYIDRALPFAQPILHHVRALVHSAVPDAQEAVKWGMPFFTLAGRDVAMMAAFKAHAGVGIFDGSAMGGGVGSGVGSGGAMGNVGKLAGLADLPDDETLIARLHAAVALAKAGKPARAPKPAVKAELAMPADLATALAANPAALAHFDQFSASARRDYVEWVISAKQPATRARRIETTVAQAAEARKLHWKYENC